MNARPEYEVARETLVGLMTRHAIVAQVTQTPSGITQDESGWAHREWRFSLRIGGETILANAPYRAGTGIAPESLRDVDLVAAVLTDAAIAAPHACTSSVRQWAPRRARNCSRSPGGCSGETRRARAGSAFGWHPAR
jgi:hypothetical protein